MKTLILTRHGKSGWDDLTLQDHERSLNKRGRASSQAIGNWLNTLGHHPEQVISSNATRCTETWDCLSKQLPEPQKTSFYQRLYLAAPETIYEALKQARHDTVLMLGHNPGFADFASKLAATKPSHPQFPLYPTAATTVFKFDIPTWTTPFLGQGMIADFTVPRDLLDT